MRRRIGLVTALAASSIVSGCGGTAGDLLSIRVEGGPAGANQTLVVTGDGRGSCDRGPLEPLPSERVIAARKIERDVIDLAKAARTFTVLPGRRRYVLKTKDGVVRWSDGAPNLPAALPRAQLLALRLGRELCR